jgi:hypothetical protein
MARLSVAVMAHRNRAHLVEGLVEQLGINDDQVVWDRHDNRWDTGRRAWEAHDPQATHHLVVQDDARVCRDLVPALEQGLDHVPAEAIVSPYVGTRRPMAAKVERAVATARQADAAWIVMRGLNWGVSILAPVPVIPQMLPWCDRQTYPNYDRRIGRYFLEVLRWPTWCTWPSLIDHREVPSLCGHGGGRIAHDFLGEDISALDLDFSRGTVIMSTPGPATALAAPVPAAAARRQNGRQRAERLKLMRQQAIERRQAEARARRETVQRRIDARRARTAGVS